MKAVTLIALVFEFICLTQFVLGIQENGLRSVQSYKSARQAHAMVSGHRSTSMQASFMAKSALAQSSIEAASTAQAAFFGKHILLRGLEKLSQQAHHSFNAEMTQLEISKKAASIALITAQQAAEHVTTLAETLNSAKMYAEKTQQAADYANSEFASQSKMLSKAKARLHDIEHRLRAARNGFAETQVAAEKAAGAAQEAQSFAVSAAVLAAMELQQEAARLDFRKDNTLMLSDGNRDQFNHVERS